MEQKQSFEYTISLSQLQREAESLGLVVRGVSSSSPAEQQQKLKDAYKLLQDFKTEKTKVQQELFKVLQ